MPSSVTCDGATPSRPWKDQVFIRFLPGICVTMIWLYIVVYNHQPCLQRGKGVAHCYTPEGELKPRGDLWAEYFSEYWVLTVAMIFGSLIAGSTPLGGGVVAFPVVVLVIGLTPDQGRDFSVCIQSIGMNAAAFLLMTVKPHLLDFKFISVFTVIGTAGVLTGLAWEIKPYYSNLLYTTLVLEFAGIYFYTNVLSPRRSEEATTRGELPSTRTMVLIHVLMFLAAFWGGLITANVGSGSDILMYAFGTTLWNTVFVDTHLMMPENMLTASSVVVMGLLSIVTAVSRAATAGVSMNVWYALGACGWLVCWGAPLGSLLLTPALQMTLRSSFYVLSLIQFTAFAVLKIKTDLPGSDKRLSSQATWVMIGVITCLALTGCVAHWKLSSARLRAAGKLKKDTFEDYLGRIVPLKAMRTRSTNVSVAREPTTSTDDVVASVASAVEQRA